MELKFKVSGRISKPVEEVFEAVVDQKKLSGYFTTGGASARLETGTTVTWDFADFPGAFPVEVVEVEKNRKIVLRWDATDGNAAEQGPENVVLANYKTTITMTFEPVDGNRTLVTIAEEGWRETQGGLAASYGNCQGWSQMLCALKAYVEYGINLREGMYK
ncbi:SRPBCC family protein [Rhizobium sp. LC145]|uniref:SRPBCC family protein n=1 Tax=Rhizobium sp. LC145 TaxID=1120688 RepID=UPI00062A08A4|nr:SRPBCC family protein [Rhizobium sp. LC145]KKX29486.1 ATPase [Rhizobium sp. LC145]TKT66133.1 ATPase [Rhizobiaceae bacterium LC148]